MILQHLSLLMDSNHTRGSEDLIIRVTPEPLCSTCETRKIVY